MTFPTRGTSTRTPMRPASSAKSFLSIGHDEYWSQEMYDHVQAAIAAGVNVAFLSGDTCRGLISLVAERGRRFAPGHDAGGNLRTARTERGEGLSRTGAVPAFWPFGSQSHWGSKRLALQRRSRLDLRGRETLAVCRHGHEKRGRNSRTRRFRVDGAPAEIPGLEVVAQGPFKLGRLESHYAATLYPGPKDNLVFNAATIWWADGLSAPPGYKTPSAHGATPKGPDRRVQQITTNLFRRMRGA